MLLVTHCLTLKYSLLAQGDPSLHFIFGVPSLLVTGCPSLRTGSFSVHPELMASNRSTSVRFPAISIALGPPPLCPDTITRPGIAPWGKYLGTSLANTSFR